MKPVSLTLIFIFVSILPLSAQTQMQKFWDLQVDALTDQLSQGQPSEMQQLEEAELDKTQRLIYRYERLEQYRLKLKGVAPSPSLLGDKVAILGNSSNPFLEAGFNPETLGKLLDQIKKQKPKALFFTGNFVWSLQLPEEGKTEKVVTLSPVYDTLGQVLYQPSGVYASEQFGKRLGQFAEIVKAHLGTEIPFYPVLGESEIIGPDSVKIFLDHFPIPNHVLLDSGQLVYNVSIGKGNFTAISFSAYDPAKSGPIKQLVTPPLLQWVGKTLEEASKKSPFLFVVGSVPAFSTGGASGAYTGLDRDRDSRTRFWQVLMKHKVLAYFCSNEALYDRTYRYGIWQIISGGAGAEYELQESDTEPFLHYLLLTIPERTGKAPLLEVFDINGQKRDEVLISSQLPALYQFRQ